jgi:hypothetical protein
MQTAARTDACHVDVFFDFRNAGPPLAPTLQLIGGTPAGSAGSFSVNIHRLPKHPEEVLPLLVLPLLPALLSFVAVRQFGSCGID